MGTTTCECSSFNGQKLKPTFTVTARVRFPKIVRVKTKTSDVEAMSILYKTSHRRWMQDSLINSAIDMKFVWCKQDA